MRVRAPRVNITYDVENGSAIEKRELPFIVGIFADLSGDRLPEPTRRPVPFKERQMTDIDRDNFNDIMKSIGPRVDLTEVLRDNPAVAASPATPDDRQIVFENMDDFGPTHIIGKLPALNSKYESRGLLRSLRTEYESDDHIAEYLDALTATSAPTRQPASFKQIGELAAVDDTERPALRKALFDLQNAVAGSDSDADQATVLQSWSLLSAADAATTDAAVLKANVAAVNRNAAALARARAAADNPANRARAILTIEQLQLTGTVDANAVADANATLIQRNSMQVRLGFLEPAPGARRGTVPADGSLTACWSAATSWTLAAPTSRS